MPAPTFTLPTTGSDPKLASAADFNAALNVVIETLWDDIQTRQLASGMAGYVTTTALTTALAGRLAAGVFANPEVVIAGLDEALPVNSAGVYAALQDFDRRLAGDIQAYAQASAADGVVSPGIVPSRYGVASEGAPGYVAAVRYPLQVDSGARGKVLVWRGSGALAVDDEAAARLSPIAPMPLASGRKFKLRAVFRRRTASADPAGDAVRVAVQWLAADFSSAGLAVTETNILLREDLTPADGYVTATATIAQAAGTGIDHANAEAVYARVFVEQQGNTSYVDGPEIEVLELSQTDVTDAEVLSGTAAGVEARLTVLENRDPFATTALATGTDLRSLTAAGDYYVASPVNGPSDASALLGVALRVRDANTAHMRVWDLMGANSGAWWAAKVGGTWASWQRIASRGYVDQAIAELANSIDGLGAPLSGTCVPTLAFATVGTSTWSYGVQVGWWARSGNLVTWHVTVQGTPTKGTGSGALFLDLGFRDALLAPVSILPIFDGAASGTCPVKIGTTSGYPMPAGAKAPDGEIRFDSAGRVKLGYTTNTATDAVAGVAGRANLAASQITDAAMIQLAVSGSFVVAA